MHNSLRVYTPSPLLRTYRHIETYNVSTVPSSTRACMRDQVYIRYISFSWVLVKTLPYTRERYVHFVGRINIDRRASTANKSINNRNLTEWRWSKRERERERERRAIEKGGLCEIETEFSFTVILIPIVHIVTALSYIDAIDCICVAYIHKEVENARERKST